MCKHPGELYHSPIEHPEWPCAVCYLGLCCPPGMAYLVDTDYFGRETSDPCQ